jgi:hypothetical protein
VYNNLPPELKALPNYILWAYQHTTPDAKPTKLPINAATGYLASVTNPAHWSTFDAVLQVSDRASGIGLVLTADAGFTCIDLDYTDDPVEVERQIAIVKAFDSYAEVSPSGKGLHLWIRASIPSGRRRGCVEMYSSERYMTMTGQVYHNAPIRGCQDLAMSLWSEMSGNNTALVDAVDQPERNTDYEVLVMASSAINGQKFIDLYEGHWELMYPSQSEADFALVNIINFYTQNKDQIIRIFRASALGKRAKAQRDDYFLNPRYGIVTRSFDRQIPPTNIDALRSNLELRLQESVAVKSEAVTVNDNTLAVNGIPYVISEKSGKKNKHDISKGKYENIRKFEYQPPPGLIGEIANFIYSSAPRPVPEIAIAGAIGLMSGVCGRAYNVSGTGLNMYTLLLSMTGAGKDGMSNGIDKLMESVYAVTPEARHFIGPAEIASPQALLKYLAKTSKSFVSLIGEFDTKFSDMTSIRASSNEKGLKRTLLDLFNKSGCGKTLGSIIYSDKDKNTEAITAPAFSILGECTPEGFYEILDEKLIKSGLLPRFTIIEYSGDRVPLNKNHLHSVPSPQLSDRFSALCAHALMLNNGNNVEQVQLSDDCKQLFSEFDVFCDTEINTAENEMSRQLWNRAHIKALKLASLLAVGCNYINPVIDFACANWALSLVVSDINNLLERFENGKVGVTSAQNEQTKEVRKSIRRFIKADWKEVEKFTGVTKHYHDYKIIPHSFITSVCRNKLCFKADKNCLNSIKQIIQSLVENDEIIELSPLDKKIKNLSVNARLFMVSKMRV